MRELVIDVSELNRRIDFTRARDEEGVTGVIVRCAGAWRDGSGYYDDVDFEANYEAARAAGLKVGAYFYSNARNQFQARSEAELTIARLEGKRLELPVYLDVEEAGQLAIGRDALTDVIEAFVGRMGEAGWLAGLYMSLSPFESCVHTSRLMGLPLWIAQYNDELEDFDLGTEVGMWQFGGTTNYLRSNEICGVVCDQNWLAIDYTARIRAEGLNGFAIGTHETDGDGHMATAQDVLRIARGEVGYCRWDDPQPGTKYGRWYAQITGSPYFGYSGVPYCAMFVSWVLNEAGVQCEGFPRAVAIDPRDGFARAVLPADSMPGDPIGFDWDSDNKGDHVGIVSGRDGDMVTIETIEGNTGDGEVLECVRHISQCTIAVRPYYEDATSPAKDAGLLDVDGAGGYNTVSRWQRAMGTGEDGVISGQLEDQDRWRRNVWAVEHGGEGSLLVTRVQEFLKSKGYDVGEVDGLWGWWTSKAVQEYLRDLGYYHGDIDSDFGHHSVEALQMSLNDGRWC